MRSVFSAAAVIVTCGNSIGRSVSPRQHGPVIRDTLQAECQMAFAGLRIDVVEFEELIDGLIAGQEAAIAVGVDQSIGE